MKKLVQLRDHYLVVWRRLHNRFKSFLNQMQNTVRPQAARTSQVQVFELGPNKFEMNEFMF